MTTRGSRQFTRGGLTVHEADGGKSVVLDFSPTYDEGPLRLTWFGDAANDFFELWAGAFARRTADEGLLADDEDDG